MRNQLGLMETEMEERKEQQACLPIIKFKPAQRKTKYLFSRIEIPETPETRTLQYIYTHTHTYKTYGRIATRVNEVNEAEIQTQTIFKARGVS